MKIWSSQSKTDHFFLKWLDYDLTMKQAKNKWLWLDYDWLSQNNDYNIFNLWLITQLWQRADDVQGRNVHAPQPDLAVPRATGQHAASRVEREREHLVGVAFERGLRARRPCPRPTAARSCRPPRSRAHWRHWRPRCAPSRCGRAACAPDPRWPRPTAARSCRATHSPVACGPRWRPRWWPT